MTQPSTDLPTHRVENQPPPRTVALWDGDLALQDRVPQAARPAVRDYAIAGSAPEIQEAGREAERSPPRLRLFDAGGRRLDEVVFHPAYHQLMDLGLRHGYAACAWDGAPMGHSQHAAMVYLTSQIEPGVCCPMTMTYAAVPALAAAPDLARDWTPKLTARHYDPAIAPLGDKKAATLGMAMTEKQGGSDVRANTTRAEPGDGGYRLTGHKWFCSAPMSDGFLTLAQAPGGLTCFLVPRWLPEGRNAIHLQRLKDKLGNRANASAEIEYHGALAHRVGDEGAGVRTILTMVHHTRLDTALAPAGLMRAALCTALHWATHRTAFQKRLIDQPLMQTVLADLALEVEGALTLGLRVARAFDEGDQGFARIAVALAKFYNNKRAPLVIYECMEAMGGMGYVEDTPLPMLYREAPLNSIWEGSGNVICLDILRTLARDPAPAAALEAALQGGRGTFAEYDAALERHREAFQALPSEAEARLFAEQAGVLLTAAALIEAGSPLAEAFCRARLGPDRGGIAGTVRDLPHRLVLDRARAV